MGIIISSDIADIQFHVWRGRKDVNDANAMQLNGYWPKVLHNLTSWTHLLFYHYMIKLRNQYQEYRGYFWQIKILIVYAHPHLNHTANYFVSSIQLKFTKWFTAVAPSTRRGTMTNSMGRHTKKYI